MITITGAGDHDRPEWLITMTGIRSRGVDSIRDLASGHEYGADRNSDP
jgi:hypothetical protein